MRQKVFLLESGKKKVFNFFVQGKRALTLHRTDLWPCPNLFWHFWRQTRKNSSSDTRRLTQNLFSLTVEQNRYVRKKCIKDNVKGMEHRIY